MNLNIDLLNCEAVQSVLLLFLKRIKKKKCGKLKWDRETDAEERYIIISTCGVWSAGFNFDLKRENN